MTGNYLTDTLWRQGESAEHDLDQGNRTWLTLRMGVNSRQAASSSSLRMKRRLSPFTTSRIKRSYASGRWPWQQEERAVTQQSQVLAEVWLNGMQLSLCTGIELCKWGCSAYHGHSCCTVHAQRTASH